MSVEWDEELARQLFQNLGGSLAAWSVDFWTFFQMGKSEHDRADAEHAARLEAEAERDALVERVDRLAPVVTAVLAWINDEAVGHEEGSSGYRQAAWDVRRVVLNADAAILSDQEGRE